MINPFEEFYKLVAEKTGSYLIPLIATAIIIIALTFLVTWLVAKALRKYLSRGKSHIPAMSIYINIAKILCWSVGIAILLSTCFGVNVTGLVAALGVGGIAISLGFKDTVANLISGVQISSLKIMEPGDHVQIGSMTGIVKDTTWRHTEITNMNGETIVVPNSVINAAAVIKKKSYRHIRVHVNLDTNSKAMTDNEQSIDKIITDAIEKYGETETPVKIVFTSIAEKSSKGAVTVTMADEIDGQTVAQIKDAIVKAISPYA